MTALRATENDSTTPKPSDIGSVDGKKSSLENRSVKTINTKGFKVSLFSAGLFALMSVAFLITSIVFPIFAVFIAGAAILTLLGTASIGGLAHFLVKYENPQHIWRDVSESRKKPLDLSRMRRDPPLDQTTQHQN